MLTLNKVGRNLNNKAIATPLKLNDAQRGVTASAAAVTGCK